MNRDAIIRMAAEAGCEFPLCSGFGDCRVPQFLNVDQLVAFANRIATVEREACAEAVKALRDDHCESTGGECQNEGPGCDFVAAWNDAIDAIRARGAA